MGRLQDIWDTIKFIIVILMCLGVATLIVVTFIFMSAIAVFLVPVLLIALVLFVIFSERKDIIATFKETEDE